MSGASPSSARYRTRASSTSPRQDRKSTRLNSSHDQISYAVFCLKKKNPLAAIAAFGEALALEPHQSDLQESAERIRREAMPAGRIAQTLLDFARQRPRMQTPVDLGEIADRVLALQRSALKKARIRATISIPHDLPAVSGDPQELQQVMLNAVVNAGQAIEGTGRPGQIAITGRSTDHHVLVTVDDTGPGVPPEILDRVFEPFFSTKAEHGTGLGLAISFGLVRGMGGRMWMQNVEGGGARLSFELPADEIGRAHV